VEAGSFNYTRSAASRNSENVLVINEVPEVAQTYLQHWQSRWDGGTDWHSSY
ncbi:phospholipase D family protein, partial [Enterobacter hormaechei]